MGLGLLGGIIGGALGLLGGVVGTYFSIKNTAGPRERTFMIRVAILTWILVAAFICGLFAIPKPFNFLLWLPYGIALPLAILWCNRRQRRIRAEEASGQFPLTDQKRQFGRRRTTRWTGAAESKDEG